MKVKFNIREHLEANAEHVDILLAHASIDIEEIFDLNGIPEEDEIDVDLDELLAQDRKIAQVWGIDDVRAVRPDLDDDAAWDVLLSVNDDLDAQRGLIRDAIEHTANALYPHKLERHWQGRIDVRITDPDIHGRDEALTRLSDMAYRIARHMPGKLEATVDPGSIQILDSDETTGN